MRLVIVAAPADAADRAMVEEVEEDGLDGDVNDQGRRLKIQGTGIKIQGTRSKAQDPRHNL
jgi:hypothetical protein